MPGAEAWSVDGEPVGAGGGRVGALCLHGFTGNPTAMRPVAEAFAAARFAVELPRLPGHGTTVDDMATTGWTDWTAAAEDAYQRLAARCDRVVAAGLSMGGSLAVWLAARHEEIAGIVCINPVTRPEPEEVLDMVRGMVAEGEDRVPSAGADIADPDGVDTGYEATPLVPLLSLMDGLAALQRELGAVTCPALIMTSADDHVIDPVSSDHLAAALSGPVERIVLPRSYHVATLDYDRDLVCQEAVAFAQKVTTDGH
jgi:carboxylesterase